jgi:F0F1-type ATP synthase epsilon subunit
MLSVRIIDPTGEVFSGDAESILGQNALGPFSLLTDHAQFISIIRGTITIIASGQNPRPIAIGYGLIYCNNNQVTIFARLPELAPAAQ